MDLSIVSTLYRSEQFVDDFCRRMIKAAEATGRSFEIILVDDGSPDDSGKFAIEIARRDSRVVVVTLSRNFGHHKAIMAGLSEAKGDDIFLIDSDLEEDPEWLQDFLNERDRTGADVVYGVQVKRSGSFLNRWVVGGFYTVFNRLSEIRIPANACTVRLMCREYVDVLVQLRDRNLFLGGVAAWAGFHQVGLPVAKSMRQGRSTYTPAKMVALLVDAITSFTAYPLKMIFTLGLMIAATAGIIGLEMLARKILEPESVLLGYSSIMVSIWFLGGLLIFFVGIVGLYLSKMFSEVKERPLYVIRRIHRSIAVKEQGKNPGAAHPDWLRPTNVEVFGNAVTSTRQSDRSR